jgi:hypothetical protein
MWMHLNWDHTIYLAAGSATRQTFLRLNPLFTTTSLLGAGNFSFLFAGVRAELCVSTVYFPEVQSEV